MTGRDFAQALQEPRVGQQHAHVADHRLDDDCRDALGRRAEAAFDGAQVIELGDERVLGDRLRDAGTVRHPERRRARSGPHQQRIDVPVIAAGELDDPRPSGSGAGDAQGRHGCLGTRAHQADHVHRRNGGCQPLGHVDLACRRRAETGAITQGILYGSQHLRMRMPEDHRAPRADVVEVAVAVDVPDVAPTCPLDEDGLAANGTPGADGTVDASGDAFHRPGKQLVRQFVRRHAVGQLGKNRTPVGTIRPTDSQGTRRRSAFLRRRPKRAKRPPVVSFSPRIGSMTLAVAPGCTGPIASV